MSFSKSQFKNLSIMTVLAISMSFVIPFEGKSLDAKAAEAPENINHLTTFNVKFGKLSVGEMNFKIKSDKKNYVLTGGGRTKGLAEWFAAGKASLKSSGTLTASKANAQNHSISISDKKKTATLNMALENGSIKSISMKPDKTKKHLGKKYA